MKKISVIFALLLTGSAGFAYADTCATSLMPAFTANQAKGLCKTFGSAVNQSLIPSADNTYDVGSTTFGWRTGYFDTSVITPLVSHASSLGLAINGTAQWSVTAASLLPSATNTENIGSATNAVATTFSNVVQAATGQNMDVKARNGNLDLYSIGSDATPLRRWRVITTGALQNDTTNGADINMSMTGTSIALQEATAGSACMGGLTATGATPVVTATTCATTGSRIFLTRTSAETGTTDAWVSALSNGVSFSVTSEAADTGTYNWIIFHEAP